MLLDAKITRPGYPTAIVDRPRLYQRLDAWRDLRGLIIQAPAGYGKTSLVSRWLDVAGIASQAAWVTLDEDDSDPIRFVEYVAASLDHVCPGLSALVRPALHHDQPSAKRALVRLLSALPDMLPQTDAGQHVLLVLDDYHRVRAGDVDDLVLMMLAQGPAVLHLILPMRRRPELPLARLHAQGKVAALTATDLRFTEDEIGQYLLRQGYGELSRSLKTHLAERSEGWVTALRLAQLAQQNPGNVTEFAHRLQGEQGLLADFLVDEVLKRQPPARQNFMLQISILDEFNAPLCAAVTGDPMAFAHLAALARAELFLVRLSPGAVDTDVATANAAEPAERSTPDAERSGDGGWYRFHHLFQEMLQYRLQAQISADDCAAIHRRAGRRLAVVGHVAAAVRHFLAADDGHAAAALVETRMATVIVHSPYEAKRLFALLPHSIMVRRPRLMLDRCFLALAFDERLVLAYVEQAQQAMHQLGLSPEAAPALHAELHICRGGAHLRLGNWDSVHHAMAAATPYAEQLPPHVAGTLHFLRMHESHHRGDPVALQRHGAQALDLFAQVDFAFGMVAVRRRMARWSMDRGERQAAAMRFAVILGEETARPVEALREYFFTYVYAAEERYWADDLVQAEAYRMAADELAEQLQDDELMLLTRRMRACYQRVSAVQATSPAPPTFSLGQIVSRTVFQLLLDIETRHLRTPDAYAAAWDAIQANGMGWVDDRADPADDAFIPRLRTYIGCGADLARVTVLLTQARAYLAEAGLRFRLLHVMVLSAWHLLRMEGIEAAAVDLSAVVQLAQETGYVRVLFDYPPVVAALGVLGLPLPRIDADAGESMPIELTPREQAILTRLAQDESYPQIADELVISINTVRTHVRNLYRKLGARRREQAVAKAMMRGLLPMTSQPFPAGDDE